MTADKRPPSRAARMGQSHWSRNIWIAVIGVFVLLAALGSAMNRQSLVAEQTAPPEVGASDAIPTDPGTGEESPPAATGSTLIAIEGSGAMTSEPFVASGESVELTYEYACAEAASFTLNFYGTYDSPLLPDVLVSEFGESGAGTATESLGGTTGPFTVEVDTVCDWSIEVVGIP
ncbi:MAG: hypothetical protein WEG56_12025 [Chloroflexota bacterium]